MRKTFSSDKSRACSWAVPDVEHLEEFAKANSGNRKHPSQLPTQGHSQCQPSNSTELMESCYMLPLPLFWQSPKFIIKNDTSVIRIFSKI